MVKFRPGDQEGEIERSPAEYIDSWRERMANLHECVQSGDFRVLHIVASSSSFPRWDAMPKLGKETPDGRYHFTRRHEALKAYNESEDISYTAMCAFVEYFPGSRPRSWGGRLRFHRDVHTATFHLSYRIRVFFAPFWNIVLSGDIDISGGREKCRGGN